MTLMQRVMAAAVEKRFFATFIKFIDKAVTKLALKILYMTTPVDENKILFLTFRGEYDCNAKWIAEELCKRDVPYEMFWAITKKAVLDKITLPDNLTPVVKGRYKFYKALASSKIIVDNGISTVFHGYKKKKKQILIETWHGSLGIKKFSADTNKDKKWVKKAFKEGKMTDYIISNSTFEDEVYREDYWKTTPIWRMGHARNDILCEKGSERLAEMRDDIFSQYDLEPDTKICLYAPTFRDDGDMRPYQIDYDELIDALQTRFGGKWVIFTRFHYRMLKQTAKKKLGKKVINVSEYPDIMELLTCVDVGITDYSSWICDYLLTHRPGFLFATDMDEYQLEDRAFFYPLTDLPYPLAVNNRQLIDNILNFDDSTFVEQCDAFLQDKGCMDDGHAAERIADAIEALMKGQKL